MRPAAARGVLAVGQYPHEPYDLCMWLTHMENALTRNYSAGIVRRACIPKELLESSKDQARECKDKKSQQTEKNVTQLEAALREAAGAIQRHDKEMKKMIDRIQELETPQGKSLKIADTSVLSAEKSFERDPRLLKTPQMELSTEQDYREVMGDRQKSYLVGASVSQSVDLSTAQIHHNREHSIKSVSQSNTPMGVLPPHTTAQKDKREIAMSPLISGSNTADTSPVPGPASAAVSLRARCVCVIVYLYISYANLPRKLLSRFIVLSSTCQVLFYGLVLTNEANAT